MHLWVGGGGGIFARSVSIPGDRVLRLRHIVVRIRRCTIGVVIRYGPATGCEVVSCLATHVRVLEERWNVRLAILYPRLISTLP